MGGERIDGSLVAMAYVTVVQEASASLISGGDSYLLNSSAAFRFSDRICAGNQLDI